MLLQIKLNCFTLYLICEIEQISETTKPLKQEEEEEDEEVMEGEEDLSPEERRVLDRKMKKILKKDKKNKLKMEGKTEEMVDAHKPIAPQQALDYLSW